MKKLIFSIAVGTMVATGFTAFAAEETAADDKKGGGFAEMDADHDGSVTFDEFKAIKGKKVTDEAELKKIFAQIDKSRDGKVTEAEFKAHKERRAGKKHEAPAKDKKTTPSSTE